MHKRAVSLLVFTILVMSMLMFASKIQPARASGTIYVRADGSIAPPASPISTVDNVTYTFTDNIFDQIVVQRGNIIVDGNGHTLQGTGSGTGFSGVSIDNVTIQNTNIKNFSIGIKLDSCSNSSISGNNITNNWYGIYLYSSKNNSVSGNVFVGCGMVVWDSLGSIVADNLVNGKPLVYLEGMSDVAVGDAGQVILVKCTRIRVENLTLSSTSIGVQLWGTNNTTISGNNITTNNLDGIALSSSLNNSIVENNITNNGAYGIWLHSSSSNNSIVGNNITTNLEGIDLSSSNSSSISANNITGNGYGIYFNSSSSTNISGNNIIDNNYGLSGLSSFGSSISKNNIEASYNAGIDLWYSSGCNISGNYIAHNWLAMGIYYSSSSNISENNVTANNNGGISVGNFFNGNISRNSVTNNSFGILLGASPSNAISGNNITGSGYYGIGLVSGSDYNSICGNNVMNNTEGILYSYASNNVIYHNTFVDNAQQVYSEGSTNLWDNGYPSGGNYWNNYAGSDTKHGAGQNLTGSDGIGDEPYVIDADNRDNYPLIDPITLTPWDINRDGYANSKDAVILGSHFSAEIGQLGYTRAADINFDGYINSKDAVLLGKHFGEQYV